MACGPGTLAGTAVLPASSHALLLRVLPQGRLPEDESRWMDGGTWKGVMHEMIWDEDGEILALRPRPAAWHPPPPRPDYRCPRQDPKQRAQS